MGSNWEHAKKGKRNAVYLKLMIRRKLGFGLKRSSSWWYTVNVQKHPTSVQLSMIYVLTISSVCRIVSLVSFSQHLFTTSFVDGVLVPLLDRILWKQLAYSSFQSFSNYFGYSNNLKLLGDCHEKDSGPCWKFIKNR